MTLDPLQRPMWDGFDDDHRFEYSGPWVPYHFVNLRLEL